MITLKKKRIFVLSLLLITIISFIVSVLPCKNIVNAQTTADSDVLDDLREDASFDISDFPEQINNCSLSVITIAESENKELFVYVYQPSGPTRNYFANYINISTDERVKVNEDGSLKFFVYSLSFCNSFNTLYKYKVDNFIVNEDDTRYYQITSIYRPFIETVDKQADFDNEVTSVNFDVCKQYTFIGKEDNISVSCCDIDYIKVTDKFVGFVRCVGGYSIVVDDNDLHFVAFNTDRNIDKLLEADIWYTCQEWQETFDFKYNVTHSVPLERYSYLTYEDEDIVFDGYGLFPSRFRTKTIQKVEDFIKSIEKYDVYSVPFLNVSTQSKITDEGLEALRGKKWVLSFLATSYLHIRETAFNPYTGTIEEVSELRRWVSVTDVTILRLKFETDGYVYNLGVLDNMQTGSFKPINETFFVVRLKSKWKWVLIIIAIIILLIFFWPVLPYVIKITIWIIALPFKVISVFVKLFKKIKSKNKRE